MSNTATPPLFNRVLSANDAPACWRAGWLPDFDVFPELTKARSEYLRLNAAQDAALRKCSDLRNQIEVEKQRQRESMRNAYLAGEQPQTGESAAALTSELAEAELSAVAASEALLEHINRTIAIVIEHKDEWLGAITDFQANVDGEIAGLVEQAKRLRASRGNFARLEHWVFRTAVTAAELPSEHFPYAEIEAPLTGDPAEDVEKRLADFFERSYAGGLVPQRRATPAEAAAIHQAIYDGTPVRVPDEPEEEVELAELDDDDLVDWLMGCGGFDGQEKPSGELVVQAAGEDPDLARRLIQAEQRVGAGGTPRQYVIDRLTEITNSKEQQ